LSCAIFLLMASAAQQQAQGAIPPQKGNTTGFSCENLKNWRVTFGLSGGFAGLRRTLDLSSNGELTAVDQKLGKQVSMKLPRVELDQLTALIVAACPFDFSIRALNCPDCLEYMLRIDADAGSFSIQVNDRTLSQSGLEKLISGLVRLQEQALSSGPGLVPKQARLKDDRGRPGFSQPLADFAALCCSH
jgi:hypothetical protein